MANAGSPTAPAARLYPNPATIRLTVPTPGRVMLITDGLGRVVHTQAVPAGQPATLVDVQHLRPRFYFLTLRNAAGLATVQLSSKE